MPPTRTQSKKPRGISALPGHESAPEGRLKAHECATAVAQCETESTAEAPAQAPTGPDEVHRAPEAVEAHDTKESDENCQVKANPAVLKVKRNNASRKTSTPMNQGLKEAIFDHNFAWETNYRDWIGSKTKMVTFGSGFVLKDEHIDELIAAGPKVCGNLTHFTFHFINVYYDAENSAEEVTNEALIRLITLCPKLRSIQLQGTSGLSDITLETIFRCCPNISFVEITTHSRNGNNQVKGSALDKLRENPSWGTKLKKLRLPLVGSDGRDPFTRAVRALTKERVNLLVQLIEVREIKKWGDWELDYFETKFRKGRKQ
ncbi:hypothetical protein E4U17_007321 [Claviceps sp. LM77 group G4]|nr:hypothetical protein E4U17_007321 [Claviceps sp. LM77 group G4]KAG6056139.1 hypothetical protein E4U33_007741 [Claviceps sp. LM78 group G4]KAG6084449.1 hypothetical protein E4U16_001806 [Claviceps sp. LM84 group G4]